jgi:hypothetical protein
VLLGHFLIVIQSFIILLIVDGAGKSTRALFAILIKGCLFRVGLFIILCVAVVP